MLTFSEVLDNIVDENIHRNSKNHFSYVGDSGLVDFTVSESDHFTCSCTTLQKSVLLAFEHTGKTLLCEMKPLTIQYAVLTFVESDESEGLSVIEKENSFTYSGDEFPGTLEKFKSDFIQFLSNCKSISGSHDTSYPIERLVLNRDFNSVLSRDGSEFDLDTDSAKTLLRPVFDESSIVLPEFKSISFGKNVSSTPDRNIDIFDELVTVFYDFYFDLHDSDSMVSLQYRENLKSLQNESFSLVLAGHSSSYVVYGDILAYVSEIGDSDRVYKEGTDYIVSNTDQPVLLSEIAIYSLEV